MCVLNLFIGDIEMVLEFEFCISFVICNLNVMVMVLDMKNYDCLVVKKN